MEKFGVRLTLAVLVAALPGSAAWAQVEVRAAPPEAAAWAVPLEASAGLTVSPLSSVPALAAGPLAVASLAAPTSVASAAFMEDVARGERGFYQPGVAYDASTGMTFDSHAIDFKTGELRGKPRTLSAASKEALHLILLVKALQGRREAQFALSPDPNDPSKAAGAALTALRAKIGSYEKFDRDYPGYGGFLPWFQTSAGQVVPDPNWTNRVPALDNGEWAWSLYATANALQALGQEALARRYQAQFDLLSRNVVRIFFDPTAKKIRGVAVLERGNQVQPASNSYATEGYYVDDPHEGLLMLHFADLFGDWTGHEQDREALWARPLRKLVDFERWGKRITVEQAWVGSSHEQWGFLVLPFLDEPRAAQLYRNAQSVRTVDAAARGWPGLRASTHRPVSGDQAPKYESRLGVAGIGTERPSGARIFAPYAAFPLAAASPELFVSWLKRMLAVPGMRGPYGMGESFDFSGRRRAPLLTWDGKALTLIAWLGGISSDIRALLIRDGLYDRFRARVAADYRRLEGRPIYGADVPPVPPPAS